MLIDWLINDGVYIKGYEGLYKITKGGSVKSLKTGRILLVSSIGRVCLWKGRVRQDFYLRNLLESHYGIIIPAKKIGRPRKDGSC